MKIAFSNLARRNRLVYWSFFLLAISSVFYFLPVFDSMSPIVDEIDDLRNKVVPFQPSAAPIGSLVTVPAKIVPTKTPKIVHFTVCLDDASLSLTEHHENRSCAMQYQDYLAVKAVRANLLPEAIYLYTTTNQTKPSGQWFEKLSKSTLITEVRAVDLEKAELYKKPLSQFKNKEAALRLWALLNHGGIVIDRDVIVLKQLDDLFYDDLVLAKDRPGDDYLLPNDFVVAKKSSTLLQKWAEACSQFDDSQHCLNMPTELARQFPSDVLILDHLKVASPLCHGLAGVKAAFLEHSYDFSSRNYAINMMTSTAGALLRNLTAHKINNVESSLFCSLRPLIAGEIKTDDLAFCPEIDQPSNIDAPVSDVVAEWALKNLAAWVPAIEDASENQLHGMMSPLNGFQLVNETAVSLTNCMSFAGGDHAYLPVRSKACSNQFTLSAWLKVGQNSRNKQRSVLMSVDFDFGQNNFVDSADKLSLDLATMFVGDSLSLTIEGVHQLKKLRASAKIGPLSPSIWYLVAISGDEGAYSLRILANCSSSSSASASDNVIFIQHPLNEKFEVFASRRGPSVELLRSFNATLSAVWLARKSPTQFLTRQDDVDLAADCEMAKVNLYSSVPTSEALLAKIGANCP